TVSYTVSVTKVNVSEVVNNTLGEQATNTVAAVTEAVQAANTNAKWEQLNVAVDTTKKQVEVTAKSDSVNYTGKQTVSYTVPVTKVNVNSVVNSGLGKQNTVLDNRTSAASAVHTKYPTLNMSEVTVTVNNEDANNRTVTVKARQNSDKYTGSVTLTYTVNDDYTPTNDRFLEALHNAQQFRAQQNITEQEVSDEIFKDKIYKKILQEPDSSSNQLTLVGQKLVQDKKTEKQNTLVEQVLHKFKAQREAKDIPSEHLTDEKLKEEILKELKKQPNYQPNELENKLKTKLLDCFTVETTENGKIIKKRGYQEVDEQGRPIVKWNSSNTWDKEYNNEKMPITSRRYKGIKDGQPIVDWKSSDTWERSYHLIEEDKIKIQSRGYQEANGQDNPVVDWESPNTWDKENDDKGNTTKSIVYQYQRLDGGVVEHIVNWKSLNTWDKVYNDANKPTQSRGYLGINGEGDLIVDCKSPNTWDKEYDDDGDEIKSRRFKGVDGENNLIVDWKSSDTWDQEWVFVQGEGITLKNIHYQEEKDEQENLIVDWTNGNTFDLTITPIDNEGKKYQCRGYQGVDDDGNPIVDWKSGNTWDYETDRDKNKTKNRYYKGVDQDGKPIVDWDNDDTWNKKYDVNGNTIQSRRYQGEDKDGKLMVDWDNDDTWDKEYDINNNQIQSRYYQGEDYDGKPEVNWDSSWDKEYDIYGNLKETITYDEFGNKKP
ncbi:hypothetical protein HR065_03145, partial [Candidatus Phytoplasma pruni]